MSLLRRRDDLPEGFADLSPRELLEVFGGPTLVDLESARLGPSIFVSIMLHGNEPAGLETMQEIVRRRGDRDLGRHVKLFIGNVSGAAQGLRRLQDQPDYNRIWGRGDREEIVMARGILDELARERPICSLDIHNNSSKNPSYAIVMHVDDATLALASRFASRAMFADYPVETLTYAVGHICPALTLECGAPGDEDGRARAVHLVERALDMEELPTTGAPQLYSNQGTFAIEAGVPFLFGDVAPAGGLAFRDDLQNLNFKNVGAGIILARGDEEALKRVRVRDRFGNDITERFLQVAGGILTLRRAVVPAMLTHDSDVIAKDCVGYFMEPLGAI